MPLARVLLFLATAMAIVLVGRSVLIAPVPFAWALGACVAYAALFLSGVFVLRLRMFVDAVLRGPRGARGVALTFDDGPHVETTMRVLDQLDAAGAKATFFVIAAKAERAPDVVRSIVERGHTLGLHSYAHHRLFALARERAVRSDLTKGIEVLTAITGERPIFFRPPIGHTNPTIARVASELGLVTVGWSVWGVDGLRSSNPARVAARVALGLREGAIVLLHDAAERDDFTPASLEALPLILNALHRERLPAVALSAWGELS